MPIRTQLRTLLLAGCVFATFGCEGVSHENIDKWETTEKGPDKLLDTLKSADHSADLRAHAAQALIGINRFAEVKAVLQEMDEEPRQKVMAELATRLWEMARINDARDVPNPRQINAKDALFYTMEFASAETKIKMADYVIEWFVGGHYEGRAKTGRVSGPLAIRTIGGQAGRRLLNIIKETVNTPPDKKGRRLKAVDELLRAFALSGDAKALNYLIDLVDHPRGDTTLPERVIAALYFAFVEPTGVDPMDGKALIAVSERISKLPYDEAMSATLRNDSVALLAAIGAPECIPFFTKMISTPVDHSRYRWMGAQKGMRCAGVQGIEAITGALSPDINYERGLLDKYLWDEIYKLGDDLKVARVAENLLQSDHWVSRVTGIEVLARIGSAKNVESIKALSKDRHRLKNWWGAQEGVDKAERKPEPTIGELATNVAHKLETGASPK